jgi:hypothetical protein
LYHNCLALSTHRQEHCPPSSNGYLCVSVETQRELQLIERNVKDETSGSEDEEASPGIGHDICLETYTGSVTVTQNTQVADHICPVFQENSLELAHNVV